MGHYVSFVIQSWHDEADDAMRWQVRCVDQEPLRLPDGSFVVRTWIDDDEVVRGLVRHVQSGQEMQFQSSKRALDFVRAWIATGATPWLDGQEGVPLEIDLPAGPDRDRRQPDV